MRPSARIPLAAVMALASSALPSSAVPQEFLPGFKARVRGEVLAYHSPLPDVDRALLVRSLDAARAIEWDTAPVPDEFEGEVVHFVWMFGLHVGADRHAFELHVGGRPWFRFENPLTNAVRDWRVAGPEGSELRFRATMVDRFDDLMGLATLRLPRSAWTPGAPVRLAVVGESADSRAWYMTFVHEVREDARLLAVPAVLRGADGAAFQQLNLDIVHLGEPTDAVVRTSSCEDQRAVLHLGGNRIVLRLSGVDAARDVTVSVSTGGRERYALGARVAPPRPWSVDLVQHTHTDIGYTRPQTEILPELVRFLDTALDLCDQTDGEDDDARFRWTCETSWAVREYLETRPPEQLERLRHRVHEGRIEVTGLFLNGTDVVDEAGFAASLQPISAIRAAGIPVTTAMQDDVNGIAWCLADWASDLGIEFIDMGQHGHRALVPFDVPTCFWWESPAGRRVLAFRADHYMTGNFHGVHTGRVEAVEGELLAYLGRLERDGYAFDRVAVQHSGYPTDNAPPSTASTALVREWNAKYVWPRLRCAVVGDFLRDVKAHHAADLPVLRAAWPDWWTDGFGSAPRETAAARRTQARLCAIEALLAFERLAGIALPAGLDAASREARDALLFYGEHTFGAAESIREPLCENSLVQWAEKASYAWEAVKRTALLEERALGVLTAALPPAGAARLVVFNPLGTPRSGTIELYVDHQLLPIDRPSRIVGDDGRELQVQLLRSRAEGSTWAIRATDVPAFGLRAWRIAAGDGEVPAPPRHEAGDTLENAHFRVEVDARTGGIASLVDKATGRELVDPQADWTLGQIVHEKLGNREQLEGFALADYARNTLVDVVIDGVVSGPLWDTLSLHGDLPGCDGVRCELRLHHADRLVELRFAVQKTRVFEPEGLYVAFPFRLPGARVALETLGGIVAPDGGLIPGTATDWQAVQGFVAAQGTDGQIVLASPDVPLVQLGGIRTGEFQRTAHVAKPWVVSWVANNYWTTNFAAGWDGELRFGYALTSDTDASDGTAMRFGQEQRVPLLGRVMPARPGAQPSGAAGLPHATSLLPLPPGVALVSARPTDRGIVLLVREVDGHALDLPLDRLLRDPAAFAVSRVDAIGAPLAPSVDRLELRPRASAFLLVELRR